ERHTAVPCREDLLRRRRDRRSHRGHHHPPRLEVSGLSIAVIINPVAGGARPATARSRAEFAAAVLEQQGEPAEVFLTERAGHARELTLAAVARGARLVMAWGGDGTINEVGSALAFGHVPLGIIPAGSGNGLATELGVDRRPERAIANAVRARPSTMDLGEI